MLPHHLFGFEEVNPHLYLSELNSTKYIYTDKYKDQKIPV